MATHDTKNQNNHGNSRPSSPTPGLTQPAPSSPPGERLANYFDNFFKTIVGISTLGASLTFNKIVDNSPPSPTPTPDRLHASSAHLLTLLSVSWLFFILALAFTSFFVSALQLWRPAAVKAFGTTDTEDRKKVLWFASAVSAFLLGLIIVAFIFLSLVVAGYVGGVGWVAVAFTSVFGALGFGVIIWRSPLEWPRWMVKGRGKNRKPTYEHEGEEEQVDLGTGASADGDEVESEKPYYGSMRVRGVGGGGGGGGGRSDQAQVRIQQMPPAPPRPLRPSQQQQQQQQQDRRGSEGRYYDSYGRSTSGEYGPTATSGNTARRYGSGGAAGAQGRDRESGTAYDPVLSTAAAASRYSRASTIIPDAYEPGRYGQGGYLYDDGVREGLVISRYT